MALGRRFVLVGLALAWGVAATHGAYIVTPLHGGQSSFTVEPNQAFDLDIVLTSDAADQHNSAIFRVNFRHDTDPAPGLRYDSYIWSAPYETGTFWDDSKPIRSALPAVLDANTLSGPGYTPGVVDVELSNVIPTGYGLFGQGVLTTLTLTVPATFAPDQTLWINVQPDTFANGFDEIPTTAGPVFALHIVPEPGSCLLVGLALVAVGLRRTRYP